MVDALVALLPALVVADAAELLSDELPVRLLSELTVLPALPAVLLAALVALPPAALVAALLALGVTEEAVADSVELVAKVEALLAETAAVLVAVVVDVLAAGICSMMISTSALSAPALEAEVVLLELEVSVAAEPPAILTLMNATMSPAVFTKLPARGMFCVVVLIVAVAAVDDALLELLSVEELPVTLAVLVPVVAPAVLKPPDQPLLDSMLW